MPNILSYQRRSPGILGDRNDMPRQMNRYAGGHRRTNQVLINGYWYLILSPPDRIFNGLSGVSNAAGRGVGENQSNPDTNDADNTMNAERWFHCTAESFTPPSRTLRQVDVNGQGGVNSSFIAGQDITRTFTVGFREYQNMPIIQQLSLWTSIIDPHLGISPLGGDEFIPANYKGDCWFLYVRPTSPEGLTEDTTRSISANDIEQVMYFEGVFPQTANIDALNQDISGNDMVQVSVTFSFDGFPQMKLHPWILDRAVEEMNNRVSWASYYDNHISKEKGSYIQPMSPAASLFGSRSESKAKGRDIPATS